MDDEAEEVTEEPNETSWTVDEWHDMESPSLGRTQGYTNMMRGKTRDDMVEE